MNSKRPLSAPVARASDAADATPESEPPERLHFDLVEDDGDWSRLGDIDGLVQAAAAAIVSHGVGRQWLPAIAAVALSSDSAVRRLNRNFRGKDSPTNVLSFKFEGAGHALPGARMLGDIVLADGVVLREAAELGIPLQNHFQHLIVHGTLHLMGYDHETEHEAVAMERLETEVLDRLGIPDPHAAPE